MSSFADLNENWKQFKGVQPAADYISKATRREVLEIAVPSYVDFIQGRTSLEASSKARDLAYSAGFEIDQISSRPFYINDKDFGMNGAMGNAYAIVRPGKSSGKLRIIAAHTDVPCLKLSPHPIAIESCAVACVAAQTALLSADCYGGVRASDWLGMNVDLVGRLYTNSKEYIINYPGFIPQKSLHVEDGCAKQYSTLKVDIGVRSLQEIYDTFGIKSSSDFGSGEIYVVPSFSGGQNGRLIGNSLTGFGHDDRSCLWAATQAIIEENKHDTDNTLMVFGLDREEVGSTGTSGAYKGFMEGVINDTLKMISHGDIDFPLDLSRGLLGDMPAISADVGIALGNQELEMIGTNELDIQNCPKSGWGCFIDAEGFSGFGSRTTSPRHISNLVSLLEKNLIGRNKSSRFHITGNSITQDSDFSSGTMSDELAKFMPCVDMGIPVIGLHHPTCEVLNIYDLFWTKEAYKIYLQN